MTDPQEQEMAPRNRAASLEDTRGQARLYGRISLVLKALFILLMALYISLFYGLLPDSSGSFNPLIRVISPVTLIAAALVFVAPIMWLDKRARRLAQPRFVDLDSPPGVLFLRPFSEDRDVRIYASWGQDRPKTSFRGRMKVTKFQLRRQFANGGQGGAAMEFGYTLQAVCHAFGSVAAIGEPDSPPILGADNVYVSDDGWQEKVLELARDARLVIITAGDTPGVAWEVENILRIVEPTRLLLNVPGMTQSRRRAHYKAFRERFGTLFPQGLPEALPARTLSFDQHWSIEAQTKDEPPAETSRNVAWWLVRVLP